MIQELLGQFGLTDKETLVYLTVLERGKISYAQVGKIAKINRTTVYSVAKELISKGLITEDLAGKSSYLVALPPTEIQTVIDKEEKELFKKKQAVSQIVSELKKISQNTQYTIPKISFIEE